jgi:hypothetical protein
MNPERVSPRRRNRVAVDSIGRSLPGVAKAQPRALGLYPFGVITTSRYLLERIAPIFCPENKHLSDASERPLQQKAEPGIILTLARPLMLSNCLQPFARQAEARRTLAAVELEDVSYTHDDATIAAIRVPLTQEAG